MPPDDEPKTYSHEDVTRLIALQRRTLRRMAEAEQRIAELEEDVDDLQERVDVLRGADRYVTKEQVLSLVRNQIDKVLGDYKAKIDRRIRTLREEQVAD